MKSIFSAISTVTTAIVLATGFAASASAATFSEAPEFRSGASTLSRATVAASALGAARISEATQFGSAVSSLSRDEVCKELAAVGPSKLNELTASNLN
jgi:putative effector of murein hydrolase